MGLLLATRGPQHGIGTMLIPYSMKQKMNLVMYFVFLIMQTHLYCLEGFNGSYLWDIFGLCERDLLKMG
jgi:hypothetical protein